MVGSAAGAREGIVKRDMDLIRRILEYLEGQPGPGPFRPPELPNVPTHEVCYHARLCRQAGYISEYKETLGGDGPPRVPICSLGELTWDGHEALGRMRSRA